MMQVVKEYPDGMVSWVDLSTTDPEAAAAFYGGLFGWQLDPLRHEGEVIYHMARLDGYNVAGLGEQDEATQAQGVPPSWTTYIKHDDADAVAAAATRAGGTVLFPPMDVMDQGRMTVIMDPGGALFGVWQPKTHIGAQLVNIPNTLVWNELQTNALDAARDFYQEVFGWTYETNEQGYVTCAVDGRVQAGMMAIDPSWGEVPPNWGAYFLVSDVADTVARAKALGGTILMDAVPAEGVGAFAIIRDPQGAVFNVIEYDAATPPPPPPGY